MCRTGRMNNMSCSYTSASGEESSCKNVSYRACWMFIKTYSILIFLMQWPGLPRLVRISNQGNPMKFTSVLICFPRRGRRQPVEWEISRQNPGLKPRHYDSAAHFRSFASSPPEKEGLGDQLVRVCAKS